MMSPVKAVEAENKRLKWSKPDELTVPEVPNHTWIMITQPVN
jgi:aminoglycoside phosphotransferase